MMNSPDHPQELASHGKHGTAFGTIGAGLEQTFRLAFEGPPVMNDEGVIHENDRISRLETSLDSRHWSPPINDPAVKREPLLMYLMKRFCWHENPSWVPLKL